MNGTQAPECPSLPRPGVQETRVFYQITGSYFFTRRPALAVNICLSAEHRGQGKKEKRDKTKKRNLFLYRCCLETVRARVPMIFINRIKWNLVSPTSPSESLGLAHGKPGLALGGRDSTWRKGAENEWPCPGVQSWARGDLFWVAPSPCLPLPLRTRTSPAPTTVPPALLGRQRQRKALPDSQPPCSRHHCWDGHHHPLLWCLDAHGGIQSEGPGPGSPRTGHRTTPICSGSLRDTPTSTALQAAQRQGQPSGRIHPSRVLATPSAVTGTGLRASSVTPGHPGGQGLPREAPPARCLRLS